MLLSVTHETRYDYTGPVWLEPHTLHLCPPTTTFQTIHDFRLEIDPLPILVSPGVGVEGNPVHLAGFSGTTQSLAIRSSFLADCHLENPFSYLVYPFEATRIPFLYPEPLKPVLHPFMGSTPGQTTVREYARQLAGEVQYDTLAFLELVSRRIFADFAYEYREFGQPLTPAETLAQKKGACRDFSLLMMEMCRSLGLATRFVSGYLLGNPHKEQYLHAWVEVYVPGGGWRGYDPTQGEIVSNRHAVLAASAIPANATPVQGIFRGTATSRLTTTVSVSQSTMLSQSQTMFS
jgi:transglutaminase-like putative cysteine protease